MKQVLGYNGGYDFTKARAGTRSLCMESAIAPATGLAYVTADDLLLNNGYAGLQLDYDNKGWFVGGTAVQHAPHLLIEPRARERDMTVARVLLLSACYLLGIRSGEAQVATGLPMRWFEQDKARLAEALSGTHTFTVRGQTYTLTVDDVVVVPESFGTYYLAMVNEDGVMVDPDGLHTQHVGVMDVGGFTTNYIHISPGPRYSESGSGSHPVGMARVYELVQKLIFDRCGRELTFRETADLVRSGRESVRGSDGTLTPVADLIHNALEMIAEVILGQAKSLWGDGAGMDTILLTGGGGAALCEYVQRVFRHARLTSGDPQMANADGLYRYALRKFGQGSMLDFGQNSNFNK